MSEELKEMTLDLQFSDDIIELCELEREREPIVSKVEVDEATMLASDNFDYEFKGESKFYPFKLPEILKDLDFNILVITGSSGSGKSTFSKFFGKEEVIEWNNNKAIISNFATKEEAIDKLGAVGFNSIPCWCKPRNVLSVGEGFRVDLARRLKDNCVIDEFTSCVDRSVALSCASSVGKYIRRKNLKKCVFVSCHKDFIDTLCPDYVIDLDDEKLYDTRRLVRRKFELSIYKTTSKEHIWNIFKQYHYLSSELNLACHFYTAYLDNELVGMCAILPQPGNKRDEWRIHRLVVKPDYQGLGIGKALLEYVCDLYTYHKRVVYIRTSHIKLIEYMKRSDKWKGDGIKRLGHKEGKRLRNRKVNLTRKACSFKYIGIPNKNVNDERYKTLKFYEKDDIVKYISLFDDIESIYN